MAEAFAFDRVDRSPRLSDVVADKLLDAVVTQQFRTGDALPSERDLGIQFGVSRTVVREAIRSLSTKGVVEVVSGRGAVVLPLDTGAVREAMSLLVRRNPHATFAKMHEVRLMLEPHVAAVAAERATDEDIALIDQTIARVALVADSGGPAGITYHDFDAAGRPDVEVHRVIAHAAHNELYALIFDALGPIIDEVRPKIFRCFDGRFPFIEEYTEVANAIKQRDPEAARAAILGHLEHVSELWAEHLASGRSDAEDFV